MKALHIIGQPGSGKTTLVAALVQELTARGVAVATLKHSSHDHELDKPGKDSHVHRTAGACPAAMVTASMAAVYLPGSAASRPDQIIKTYLARADLVLIEGWLSGPYPKIEIWRKAVARPPLFLDPPQGNALDRALVCALVTDTDPWHQTAGPPGLTPPPLLPLAQIPEVADFIQDRI